MFLSALLLTGFVAFASGTDVESKENEAPIVAVDGNEDGLNPAPAADAKTSFLKTLSARVKSAGAQVYAKGAVFAAENPKTTGCIVVAGVALIAAVSYVVGYKNGKNNADNAEDADLV